MAEPTTVLLSIEAPMMRVVDGFASAMGMSLEDAVNYLFARSLDDLLRSEGWRDLRQAPKRSRGL